MMQINYKRQIILHQNYVVETATAICSNFPSGLLLQKVHAFQFKYFFNPENDVPMIFIDIMAERLPTYVKTLSH